MNEFTLDEINFLRWLLEQDQVPAANEPYIEIKASLTEFQFNLLTSIQRKLVAESSY